MSIRSFAAVFNQAGVSTNSARESAQFAKAGDHVLDLVGLDVFHLMDLETSSTSFVP